MAAQQKQPGLFAQMASTAAGVAVGSAVGHTMANAVGGLFGGGSSGEAPAQQQQQQQAMAPMQQQAQAGYSAQATGACDLEARGFTRCLESTGNDMSACDHYFKMLKACQSTMGAGGSSF
ncbi:hypothetical protein H4R18_003425 [Coemansia javaensis]|uniref:CHCH domain-containing protein n=1 Tax=Coemansia javaensis TaxID=2761396 RepID=A0A9W8H952_9FUNG|nr:hypothetical protein H4R18_003425 [Coemansia javaensis]